MMYHLFKRVSDFLLAIISIIILTPILIPIIIGLLITGEGYVWYFQTRVGKKNKTFQIWKFATMLKDSVNMKGGLITTTNDPRITPMGGFLRKSKINELPQLINILKGDMSFVGPRPVMPKSFEVYPESIQKFIYDVTPGLTGMGSLIFRNEEELVTNIKNRGIDAWEYYKNEIYPFKGELEKYYQNNYGFTTDLKILIGTALMMLFSNEKILYLLFPDLPKKDFL
jgi:lipopolysaccharide/colanic/teichoic acid biosynthesis glycosyltransferase